MATSVSAVYLNVVDAVVSKLREEFVNEGVNDSVFTELQGLWELKMMQCGVVRGPIERNSAARGSGVPAPVHDLNVPCEGAEEYKTPTADMLFPPTPLQTPMQMPLPVEPSGYHTPGGNAEYGAVSDSGPAADNKTRRSAPYMQPPSPWMTQRALGVDVNITYEEAREEDERGVSQPHSPMKVPMLKNSANEAHSETLHDRLKIQERRKADATIASIIKMSQASATIPQHDGYDDIYNDVSRVKNKWKCVLKDGIMRLNNKDILFTKMGILQEGRRKVKQPGDSNSRPPGQWRFLFLRLRA